MSSYESRKMVFWYVPAAPGTTRPERDIRGPLREPETQCVPSMQQPAGYLIACSAEEPPLETARTLLGGYLDPCGDPIGMNRQTAAAVFGERHVELKAALAAERRESLLQTPRPIRAAVVTALLHWMDRAHASTRTAAWTSVRRNAGTLQQSYGRDDADQLRIDAAAPHAPTLRPRTIRVQIKAHKGPTLEVTALGKDGALVRLAGQRIEIPLRDLETAAATSACDDARARPPAPTLSVITRAGELFSSDETKRRSAKLRLWAANHQEGNWQVSAGNEWLFERLSAYALPRDQLGADPYESNRAWEMDIYDKDRKPAVLIDDGVGIRVDREDRSRILNEDDERNVREMVERIRTRCGHDRFWTDGNTPAIETFRIEGDDRGHQ